MTALLNLWKPGIFKDRPGRRNPTVAALRASAVGHFGPKQPGRRYGPPVVLGHGKQHSYPPKGAAKLARRTGGQIIIDETTGAWE